MKIAKKLIPSIAMLMISVLVMSTASYAWFTMNRVVGASGYEVQATAEGGIVIARTDFGNDDFGLNVTSTSPANTKLIPVSTADGENWFHAYSNADDRYQAENLYGYETLTFTDTVPTTALTGVKSALDANCALYDTYQIKTDTAGLEMADLWITQCYVNNTNVQNLSKSLRVAVVCNGVCKIFAPLAPTNAADLTYNVQGTTAVTAVDTSASKTTALTKNANNTIVSAPAETVTVTVYVFFEGEDVNLFKNNLVNPDTLSLTLKFRTTSVTQP